MLVAERIRLDHYIRVRRPIGGSVDGGGRAAYTLVSRVGAKRSAAMSLIHSLLLQLSMNESALHHSMDSLSAARRTLRATCGQGSEGEGE